MLKAKAPWGLGAQLCLEFLPGFCHLAGKTETLSVCFPAGRNAAGKDGKERLGGSVLEQIPFLQNCEDEDSDEDDELDSVQHKKQRVRVSLPLLTSALVLPGPRLGPIPPSCLCSCRPAQCADALRLPSFSYVQHRPSV